MAGESVFNLQDSFLNYVRKNKTSISIFLSNGVKIQGTLVSFDSFSLMIKKETTYQFVYKHAISTIIPYGKFSMMNLASGSAARASVDAQGEAQRVSDAAANTDTPVSDAASDSYPSSGNSIEDIISSSMNQMGEPKE